VKALLPIVAALAFSVSLAAAGPPYTNRLAHSKSRYLLQHSTNPVDWYPWGPEAFAKAKAEDKPIFLSIGYSTCHWCHVMERESFSDPAIAKLMNEAFVSIKVDREERPDLDSVYLAVTRTLTGDAGWPNNVILTPSGQPYFAASYMPKERFRELIPALRTMWTEQRNQVLGTASVVLQSLQPAAILSDVPGADVLDKGYRQLLARYDAKNGGFLPEPKFPTPHHLMFLLRYWQRSGEPRALEMVETTLRAMRQSALWDARGLGFHRYAGKADWTEPHYEKMLYDQAMLALVYLEAHQATGKAEYAQIARDIFTYVLRDLRGPDGAFYSAQDSDERYYTAADRTKLKPPARDQKILGDWNGLMIAALAYGSAVLDEPKYAEAAKRAAAVIVPRPRRYLDDHAFLVWGLLNLYEATFEVRWLQSAIAIEGETLTRFRDDAGRFYITPSEAERLLVRPRETGDGAIPSGNSVQLLNLLRLGRITADPRYDKAANDLLRSVADDLSLAPVTATHLLSGLTFALGPSLEIVLAGDDVHAFQRAVFTPFAPNKIVLHRPPGNAAPILTIAPFTQEQQPIGGQPTAYICTNYLCKLPTTDVTKIRELITTKR
jgi:uncharacterized protein YyaL (SSP411 family)